MQASACVPNAIPNGFCPAPTKEREKKNRVHFFFIMNSRVKATIEQHKFMRSHTTRECACNAYAWAACGYFHHKSNPRYKGLFFCCFRYYFHLSAITNIHRCLLLLFIVWALGRTKNYCAPAVQQRGWMQQKWHIHSCENYITKGYECGNCLRFSQFLFAIYELFRLAI